MKVLFISTSDLRGGAAIAAYRLMNSIASFPDFDIKMLVKDKNSLNPKVIQMGSKFHNNINFYCERVNIFLYNLFSRKNLFDISIADSGIDITSTREFQQADIIHLHWINQGMLSLKEIGRICRSGKKIIWTMHDMWSFTGICHHAGECKNYLEGCGNCKFLKLGSKNDLSSTIFKKKEKIYKNGNITFVACSRWLQGEAKKSKLTDGHKVVSIPNPINAESYAPMDKTVARKKLNLPIDKKIMLFAAMKTSDRRKGFEYLVDAVKSIASTHDNLVLAIAGSEGAAIKGLFNLPVYDMGLMSPELMPLLYNAADVFVTPSLQENLPNTIMEAMSCGTPCIGFKIGGIPEMIEHLKTGYVAKYKNAADLANGMRWILFESDPVALSVNSRQKVLENYNTSKVAKQYIELYKET